MADFTNAKYAIGAVYPIQATESGWGRVEPLLTPEKLRMRYLFGIPLVSFFKNPFTGKADIMTDPMLKDFIDRAVNIAEGLLHMDVMPTVRKERHPFDGTLYRSFGFFNTERRPVSAILRLTVRTSSDEAIFIVPPAWIETGRLQVGQVNIVPILSSLGSSSTEQTSVSFNGGAVWLSIWNNSTYMPSFWTIEYESGFPNGLIPVIVNELIGIIAAIEVLSSLAATYARFTGHSLGIDGLSQSSSLSGPRLFRLRIEELMEERDMIIGKMRSMYGTKLFSASV